MCPLMEFSFNGKPDLYIEYSACELLYILTNLLKRVYVCDVPRS